MNGKVGGGEGGNANKLPTTVRLSLFQLSSEFALLNLRSCAFETDIIIITITVVIIIIIKKCAGKDNKVVLYRHLHHISIRGRYTFLLVCQAHHYLKRRINIARASCSQTTSTTLCCPWRWRRMTSWRREQALRPFSTLPCRS